MLMVQLLLMLFRAWERKAVDLFPFGYGNIQKYQVAWRIHQFS